MHRIGTAIVVALGALAVLVPAAAASPGTAASVAGLSRMAIDSNPDFSNLERTGERHSYVILQVWRQSQAEAIKAANPDVKVLAYKNLSAANDTIGPGGLISTGVSHEEASESHPEWFLKNKSGNRFTFSAYSFLWAMDISKSSYQNRWASNVLADLRAGPWDGVFMDDTNPTIKYHYEPDEVQSSMDTDREYQQATESALANIAPKIRDEGFLVVPNFGAWGEYSDEINAWLPYVDGGMDEMFLKWGNSAGEGYAWSGRWKDQLDNLKLTQKLGKDYIAITHSDNNDAKAARYGFATTLLGSKGRASFSLHHEYSSENWFNFYSTPIGSPVGGATKDSNGVWRRDFSDGLVLVNPNDSAREVSFGGTYSGSGLEGEKGTRMPANSALVLSREGGAASGGGQQAGVAEVEVEQAGPSRIELSVSCGASDCRHKLKVKGIGRKRGGSRGRVRLAKTRVRVGAGQERSLKLRIARPRRKHFKPGSRIRVRAVSKVRTPSRQFSSRSSRVRV